MIERFLVAAPGTSAALWTNADVRPSTTQWIMWAHMTHVNTILKEASHENM